MKTIKLILIALFTLVLGSCVKDKGNYDYKEISEFITNEIEVKLNDQAVSLPQNRKIILQANDKLSITIDGDFTKGANVEYRWKMHLKEQSNNADGIFEQPETIASTKNLELNFAKGPGNYTLFLEVKNVDAGTIFKEKFEIEVESISGLLIYHADANNKGDYSAIRTAETMPDLPAEKLGITNNIYSTINGGAKIDNPTQLWLHSAKYAVDNRLFLASTNSVTVVNYGTHEKESDDYSEIFFIPIEGIAAPQGHMNGVQTEYLIQNGDVHKIDYMNPPKKPVFGVHCGQKGCKYSPYMMSIETVKIGEEYRDYSNVVFNNTLRKFEYDFPSGMMDFGFAGGSVDISDTQMDLVYMSKGLGFKINALMKDNNGGLHFVIFDITDTNMVTSTSFDLSTHTGITENSLWGMSTRADLAFFTSGSEIYIYNIKNNRVTPLGMNLPVGAEISVIKLLNDEKNDTYDNAVLFVGYNVENIGVVLQYQFDPITGLLNKASEKQFDGFGRVLDLVLKK